MLRHKRHINYVSSSLQHNSSYRLDQCRPVNQTKSEKKVEKNVQNKPRHAMRTQRTWNKKIDVILRSHLLIAQSASHKSLSVSLRKTSPLAKLI